MSTTFPTSKQTFTAHVDNSASDLIDAGDINPIQDTVAAIEDAVGFGSTNGVLPAGLDVSNAKYLKFKKAAGTVDGYIGEDANDNLLVNIGTGKKFSFLINGTEKSYLDINGWGKVFKGFLAYLSVGTTVNDGDTVICNTEVFDIGSNYAAGTGIFTAPVAGYYSFTAQTGYGPVVDQKRYGFTIYSSVQGVIQWNLISSSGTGLMAVNGSIITHLQAAETIILQAGEDQTGAATILGGAANTYFSGYLISQD
jgi:hypothetical protein